MKPDCLVDLEKNNQISVCEVAMLTSNIKDSLEDTACNSAPWLQSISPLQTEPSRSKRPNDKILLCSFPCRFSQNSRQILLEQHRSNKTGQSSTVISLDGSIIGFQTTTPPCTVRGADCSETDKILYVSSFSDWIAQIIDEPAATITKQESDESRKRIEELSNVIEEMKSQQEAYSARLNKALDAIDKLEQTQSQYNMYLTEDFESFKSEVVNNEAKQNESILSLEEQVASARTEVTSGLSANKLTVDNLSSQLNDSKAEMIIQDVKLNEQIKNLADGVNLKNVDLQNRIFDVQSGIEHLKNEQKSHLYYIDSALKGITSNLKSEMDTLHEQQSKEFTQVADHIHEQINHFDAALTKLKSEVDNLEISSNQVQSNHTEWYSNVTKELNVLNEKIKTTKHDHKTPYLEHKLDSVMDKYTELSGRVDKLSADLEKLSHKVRENLWVTPT
ncbi:hypothetical protein HUJ04_004824 [Dendroctonus ponderosae]|nr:hypothetical protein HUJ04_004824 [Dendroctonus ponderosae]